MKLSLIGGARRGVAQTPPASFDSPSVKLVLLFPPRPGTPNGRVSRFSKPSIGGNYAKRSTRTRDVASFNPCARLPHVAVGHWAWEKEARQRGCGGRAA